MVELFFKLICAHVFGDFILTTEESSRYKNRHVQRYEGIPAWPYWLTAHALSHGALVFWVTGSMGAAFMITGFHWLIDYLKCEKCFGPHQDQFLHVVILIAAWGLVAC